MVFLLEVHVTLTRQSFPEASDMDTFPQDTEDYHNKAVTWLIVCPYASNSTR